LIATVKRDDTGEDYDEDEEMLAPRSRRQAKSFTAGSSPSIDEDRRAHHNELERKRRDHIKVNNIYLYINMYT
jgi:hypothetical protein